MTIERIVARIWNGIARLRRPRQEHGLDLGFVVKDGVVSKEHLYIPHSKRSEHIAVLGRTGTGKSSFIKYLGLQDIRAGRGLIVIDLHGDLKEFFLNAIALEERKLGQDLSERLIILDPGNKECSVGFNILETRGDESNFNQIAEFTAILKNRWASSFGARTEQLIRNSLLVLQANALTILELSPLLSNSQFRAFCLRNTADPEAKEYFEFRFNTASESMQGSLREPVLNRVSAFSADPRFRHLLGQRQSTFSLVEAMDSGRIVLLSLSKAQLGEEAATVAGLLLAKLKNSIFARTSRRQVSLFCDEIQNLVAFDSSLDVLLSEARKFGIGIVSANQFLDQYPAQMRSAIFSVGTHAFFQLSGPDAQQVAGVLDGGKYLAELLKNLPQRHMVVKSGKYRWRQVAVPTVSLPSSSHADDLYERSQRRWARKRSDIEREIRARRPQPAPKAEEVLNEWD